MVRMDSPPTHIGIRQIVSGGQTGVDRAALDAAIALGLSHGGWCPRGRIAEDGPIPSGYQLRETESSEYPVRTEQNVLDSDATLILYRGRLYGGTELTRRLAVKHGKPLRLVNLDKDFDAVDVLQWIQEQSIHILNVAGPRESSSPGIGSLTYQCLIRLFGSSDSKQQNDLKEPQQP
jgi:hypothetical protein